MSVRTQHSGTNLLNHNFIVLYTCVLCGEINDYLYFAYFRTTTGQVAFMLYAITGIPITMLFLASIGKIGVYVKIKRNNIKPFTATVHVVYSRVVG
jgi:hypothetical protein